MSDLVVQVADADLQVQVDNTDLAVAVDAVAPNDVVLANAAVAAAAAIVASINPALFAQKASNLSDLASASTARTNLGLATVAATGSYADLTGKPTVREILTAARTYYVRSDGDDSNTGLANSAGGAFLTLQKPYNLIASTLDVAGFAVTIQVVDGTYTAGLGVSQPWTGGGSITIQGNIGTPDNAIISTTSNPCISVTCTLPGIFTVRGFKLTTTTSGNCIQHGGRGTISIGNVDFAACAQNHVTVNGIGAIVQFTGSYTISGGALRHWNVFFPNVIEHINSGTITVTGTPAFSVAFAAADSKGTIYTGSPFLGFSGAATGTRYAGTLQALLNTNGGGANYFPGNGAGSVDASSAYA